MLRRLSQFIMLLLTILFAHIAIAQDNRPAAGADVSWLSSVTTAPSVVPATSRPLRPLLQQADGTPIKTTAEWSPVRAEIKQAWLEFLGPVSACPEHLDVQTLKSDRLEDCTRELIEYNAEAGRRVRAHLLRPHGKSSSKQPALVLFHGTTPDTSKSDVGLGSKPGRNTGLKLAAHGFIVICPDNFLWEEKTYLDAVAAAKQRHPHSLGMATMLADGQRAIDVLLTLPDVDPARIGAIGHSLGGKETLYLTAFDDRIRAGVASEGGLGLDSTNWDAPWYLGPAVKSPEFPRDHHELLALIAPRPFLVLGGETGRGCSDGNRSWPYIAAGQDISRLYGLPVRQGLLNHHEGHLFSPASHEKAIEWLQCYTAENKSAKR